MKILAPLLLLTLSITATDSLAVKNTFTFDQEIKAPRDANGARVVQIRSAPLILIAQNVTVTYTAKCKNANYELQISNEKKQVLFTSTGKSGGVLDISTTQFGSTFLNKHLYGKIEFGCHSKGLKAIFSGVQLQDGTQPKVVGYTVTIFDDGKIEDIDGIRDETLEFINRPLRNEKQ